MCITLRAYLLCLKLTLLLLCAAPVLNAQVLKPVESTADYIISSNGVQNADVFIGLAGWTVTTADCAVWVNALCSTAAELSNVSVSAAVRGPREACYTGGEGLLSFTVSMLPYLLSARRIIVAAHSSGSFVAHEFFKCADSLLPGKQTAEKIRYYNLDGGIGETCGYLLDSLIARRLFSITCVMVKDTAAGIVSPNAETMQRLAGLYPANAQLYVHTPQSGVCAKKWCLHQTVINRVPYNREKYDLINDYGGINAQHPAETAWLHALR